MATGGALVAIVEDDQSTREVVAAHLEHAGFRTVHFTCGAKFTEYIQAHKPDMILLDLNLPDGDGIDICKFVKTDARLRAIPVIILSGRTGELDRVLGLEIGADDYMTKPFSPREMVARVKLRLHHEPAEPEVEVMTVSPDLVIDLKRYEVKAGGKVVEVTSTEFRLLRILAARPGWVHSRDQLLDALWGNEKVVVDRTIDLHVANLRRKLGKAGRLIKSVRGAGYKLET